MCILSPWLCPPGSMLLLPPSTAKTMIMIDKVADDKDNAADADGNTIYCFRCRRSQSLAIGHHVTEARLPLPHTYTLEIERYYILACIYIGRNNVDIMQYIHARMQCYIDWNSMPIGGHLSLDTCSLSGADSFGS